MQQLDREGAPGHRQAVFGTGTYSASVKDGKIAFFRERADGDTELDGQKGETVSGFLVFAPGPAVQ